MDYTKNEYLLFNGRVLSLTIDSFMHATSVENCSVLLAYKYDGSFEDFKIVAPEGTIVVE